MSISPAHVRAIIVVAVLVLAFVIPWTYAHIAYAWPWKEKTEGDACTGKYYLTPYDKQRSMKLGTIPDGHTVLIGIFGEVSKGRQLGSFGLSAFDDNNHPDFLGGAVDLHRGDSATIEGGRHLHPQARLLRHRLVHPQPRKSNILLRPRPQIHLP